MDEWNLLLANYKMVCLQQKEVNQQRRGGDTQPMETPGWGTKDDYLQTFWILFKEQGQLLLSLDLVSYGNLDKISVLVRN
jgi:hypothetical protein